MTALMPTETAIITEEELRQGFLIELYNASGDLLAKGQAEVVEAHAVPGETAQIEAYFSAKNPRGGRIWTIRVSSVSGKQLGDFRGTVLTNDRIPDDADGVYGAFKFTMPAVLV